LNAGNTVLIQYPLCSILWIPSAIFNPFSFYYDED
jgi:hypothetical protein